MGAPANRRYFPPLLGTLIALAWLALWVWGQSPHARFLSHHHLDELRGGGLILLVFVAGWIVMIVAMMLPTSLPLVTSFHTLTNRRMDQGQLVTLLMAGYAKRTLCTTPAWKYSLTLTASSPVKGSEESSWRHRVLTLLQ